MPLSDTRRCISLAPVVDEWWVDVMATNRGAVSVDSLAKATRMYSPVPAPTVGVWAM